MKSQSISSSLINWWSTVSKKEKDLITIKLRFRSFHGQVSGHWSGNASPLISFYWKKLLGLGSCTNIGTGECCISPPCLFNTVSTGSGLQVYLKRSPSSSICNPTSTMARPSIWCNSSVSSSKRLINSPSISYDSEVTVSSLLASKLRTTLVTPSEWKSHNSIPCVEIVSSGARVSSTILIATINTSCPTCDWRLFSAFVSWRKVGIKVEHRIVAFGSWTRHLA